MTYDNDTIFATIHTEQLTTKKFKHEHYIWQCPAVTTITSNYGLKTAKV